MKDYTKIANNRVHAERAIKELTERYERFEAKRTKVSLGVNYLVLPTVELAEIESIYDAVIPSMVELGELDSNLDLDKFEICTSYQKDIADGLFKMLPFLIYKGDSVLDRSLLKLLIPDYVIPSVVIDDKIYVSGTMFNFEFIDGFRRAVSNYDNLRLSQDLDKRKKVTQELAIVLRMLDDLLTAVDLLVTYATDYSKDTCKKSDFLRFMLVSYVFNSVNNFVEK